MGVYSGTGIDDGRLSDYENSTCFSIDGLDDMLSSLPDFDEFCEEALKEAAPIVEKEMKTFCRAAIKHEGDSEMVESIKMNIPKKTKTDAWIVSITPHGNSQKIAYYVQKSLRKGKLYKSKRKYPISNALKMIWKEYGIPGKQAPQPFIQAATNSARLAVMEKLQEVFNRKIGADK